MKTIRISMKAFSIAILTILSFTGISCNGQKDQAVAATSKNNPQTLVDIHTAVIQDNLEAVVQHIKAGSNINEKDPYGGSSPLISAAVFGKTEIAKALIEAGADLNIQNNDGSTALHTSAFFCRPEIVKMLLAKGADKTIRNKYGSTAYETVSGSFAETKAIYEMMDQMLSPMGLKLDFAYIEKTRPVVASLLK